MPLLKNISVEGGIIGLWEITEKTSDFSWVQELIAHDPYYLKLASEKRRAEFLAVRALLAELTGKFRTIGYKNNGSPFLPDEKINISISHSANLAAVLLHAKNAGIDVERLGRKVREIAHKFLSEREKDFAEATSDPEKWMTVMWCAKEAVYKMAGAEGVDFIGQIILKPFKLGDSGKINARFINPGLSFKTNLNYFFLNSNAVVFGHH